LKLRELRGEQIGWCNSGGGVGGGVGERDRHERRDYHPSHGISIRVSDHITVFLRVSLTMHKIGLN